MKHLSRIFPFFIVTMIVPMVQSAVVINEIMYHPSTNGDNEEYIELFNTSAEPADLTGWTFSDGIDFDFPDGTMIEGESYLLVCRNELAIRDRYMIDNLNLTTGNFAPSKLSNGGERITLYDANGEEVDRVSYNDSSPWPPAADGQGASLELVHPLADNNNVLYWRASYTPTPGRVNSWITDVVPPRITSISRTPQVPSDSDPVTIDVQFAEGDEIQSVILSYTVDGSATEKITMNPGDGQYTANLPAQTDGTVVEYWITATNTARIQYYLTNRYDGESVRLSSRQYTTLPWFRCDQ